MNVVCDYCGNGADLVSGECVYPHRPDLYHLRFYFCAPCDAWVGCHKGTTKPLGRLANVELRRAKMAAHAAFDPLWRSSSQSREGAYKWLARQLGIPRADCHIGMFDVETCRKVVEICTAQQPDYDIDIPLSVAANRRGKVNFH